MRYELLNIGDVIREGDEYWNEHNWKKSKDVEWEKLFNNYSDARPNDDTEMHMVKFHDIPIEMQVGILFRFFSENDIDFRIPIMEVHPNKIISFELWLKEISDDLIDRFHELDYKLATQ